jgi:hypothetical protein
MSINPSAAAAGRSANTNTTVANRVKTNGVMFTLQKIETAFARRYLTVQTLIFHHGASKKIRRDVVRVPDVSPFS